MSKQAFKRLRRKLRMDVCRKPLDAYAWPGGYPLYYVTSDGAALCPDCVNAEIASIDGATKGDGWNVVGVDVNWEDAGMTCEHCSKRIESAYAEDEAEIS